MPETIRIDPALAKGWQSITERLPTDIGQRQGYYAVALETDS